MSATCSYCKQEMAEGAGCTFPAYDDLPGDTKAYPRIAHDGDRNCHDCNVSTGQLHHPGCDGEQCPKCLGQAIACECTEASE